MGCCTKTGDTCAPTYSASIENKFRDEKISNEGFIVEAGAAATPDGVRLDGIRCNIRLTVG